MANVIMGAQKQTPAGSRGLKTDVITYSLMQRGIGQKAKGFVPTNLCPWPSLRDQ